MTIHFAETAPTASGLHNIGSGQANTWVTLANAIFTALEREPSIEFIEMPEVLRDKYQYYTQADIGELIETGYTAEPTALAEAVRDYVQGYLVPGKKLGE
jgi:ADP-L-glycero-D-manno-heptose 6-epimerase